jgi:uncharacterized damage-inducible protein DinB
MKKATEVFSHWQPVRADLLTTIDRFDDAELTYRPFAKSWPAGQIMLHIADAEDGWFRYIVTRELSTWPREHSLAKYPTVTAIKGVLTEIHARTEAYLETVDMRDLERVLTTPWGESVTLVWVIWHVLEHEIHHRGELSLILGLLGHEGLDV